MIVVKGEQVVVETVEPLVLIGVETHCIVTCNAVLEEMHDVTDIGVGVDDEEGPSDERGFELLSDLLLSSVSLSFSDVKSFKVSSTELTLSPLM